MRAEAEVRSDLEKAQRTLDSIRAQIQRATSQARETGVRADSDWFLRLNGAKRALGRAVSRLQVELGEVKAAQRAARNDWSRCRARQFMVNASRILPPELYQQVLNAALSEEDDHVAV